MSKMSNTNFKLQTNCLHLTYTSDYCNQLTIDMIIDHLKYKWVNRKKISNWKGISCLCKNDEEINHNHIHNFLEWVGSTKRSCISNERYFDIELKKPVIVFIKEDENRDYQTKEEFIQKLHEELGRSKEEIEEHVEDYLDDFCDPESGYEKWEILTHAHPNISPKHSWGSKYDMLYYIWNKNDVIDHKISYNLDSVEAKLETLKKEKEKEENKKIRKGSKINELEWEFTTWLRDKVIKDNLTQSEIMDEIHKSKYHKVFYSKYNNYRNLIQDFFKCQPAKKPTPYWGKYYLPKKLYDYCMYLDKFVEAWHTGKEIETRPKPLFLSGKAKSCKTSLMVCFGDFCYWCNTWNYNNYEAKTSFNLMDDYDGNVDFKGNGTNNWFAYLKPWFGGQEVINISGKWKNGKIVSNGRPLVFISNYSFEKRFPEIEDRKYIIDCDCTIVDLGEHRLCDPEKDWIEGHNDYIEFDTRDTWWYKNKVLEKVSVEVEPPSERECDTNQENEPVLIPQVDGDWDIEEEYPVWDQENDPEGIKFKKEMAKFESDDNPLPRLGKRGVNWEYAELLPGYEEQLFKTPKKPLKKQKTYQHKRKFGLDPIIQMGFSGLL